MLSEGGQVACEPPHEVEAPLLPCFIRNGVSEFFLRFRRARRRPPACALAQHDKRAEKLRQADNWQLLLPAPPAAMALAQRKRAGARLGNAAIGPNAGLRVNAPVVAVVGALHGWVGFGIVELAFPAQPLAQVGIFSVEPFLFADHAAPPSALPCAACKMARFTATRASWTL